MPTKKQRRRRDKGRRHDYEYVYVDSEGREVDQAELEAGNGRAAKDGRGNGRKEARPARARSGRTVQPPSWRRVGKRSLFFAPLMFVAVSILSPDFTLAQTVGQTVFLLAVFLPFSYVMDAMTYRMWRRRMARDEAGGAPSRR